MIQIMQGINSNHEVFYFPKFDYGNMILILRMFSSSHEKDCEVGILVMET